MKKISKYLIKSFFTLVLVCLAFSCVSLGISSAREAYALDGGIVYIKENGKYNMNGGRLGNRSAENGGAVYVSEGGTFNLKGGTITSCSATNGGAIYIASTGTANISNGTITGNTATNGSGVYVASGGTLNVTGGTIKNDIYVAGSMVYGGGSVTGNIKLTGAEQLTINAVPSSALKITTTQTAVGTKLAKINASNFTTSNVQVSGLTTGTRVIVSNGYLVIDYIYYTVTWQNYDGTVLETDSVAHGSTPTYNGSTPTRATDSEYIYTFSGWSPTGAGITGDTTYTAQFSTTKVKYTVSLTKGTGISAVTGAGSYEWGTS